MQSALQDPVVSPRFLGWTDDASLLQRFDVEVYLLRTGTSGTLQQLGSPERTGSVTPDLNNFQYTAPQPGVYAIVVTVYDRANNSARARKIFNYNDQPGFDVTSEPAHFVGGSPRASESFFTRLDDRLTLKVNFSGRYVPKNLELSRRVEPWDINQYSIDDVYGTTFGQRSVDAVNDIAGVTNMSCVYLVDPTNGGLGQGEPQLNQPRTDNVTVENCITNLDTQMATLNLSKPLTRGATVIVWLKASDHRGEAGTVTDIVKVTLDDTPVAIGDDDFVKNRDDKYYS